MDIYEDDGEEKDDRRRGRKDKEEESGDELSRSRSRSPKFRGRKAARAAKERVADIFRKDCPGGASHKEDRWMKYQEEGGLMDRDAWEKRYGVAINLAKKGGEFAKEIAKTVDWPDKTTEVYVYPKGVLRKLDVADETLKKAIEVKSGKYVDLDEFTRNQVELDFVLMAEGWQISWYFKGRCSERLRDYLFECGIEVIEPN